MAQEKAKVSRPQRPRRRRPAPQGREPGHAASSGSCGEVFRRYLPHCIIVLLLHRGQAPWPMCRPACFCRRSVDDYIVRHDPAGRPLIFAPLLARSAQGGLRLSGGHASRLVYNPASWSTLSPGHPAEPCATQLFTHMESLPIQYFDHAHPRRYHVRLHQRRRHPAPDAQPEHPAAASPAPSPSFPSLSACVCWTSVSPSSTMLHGSPDALHHQEDHLPERQILHRPAA